MKSMSVAIGLVVVVLRNSAMAQLQGAYSGAAAVA